MIAGLGLAPDWEIQWPSQHRPFLGPTPPGACVISLRDGSPGAAPSGAFDAGSWRGAHGPAVSLWCQRPDGRAYKRCDLSADVSRATLTLSSREAGPSEWAYPLAYPLDELILLHLLARHGGVEVHACGYGHPGEGGVLLIGVSGAGKTTAARGLMACGDGVVLSDDRIVVREQGGTPTLWGTPWHGDAGIALAAAMPLRALIFLDRGGTNRLQAMAPDAALRRLLTCLFFLTSEPKQVEATLHWAGRLTAQVPAYGMEVSPGPGFARAIDEGLARSWQGPSTRALHRIG